MATSKREQQSYQVLEHIRRHGFITRGDGFLMTPPVLNVPARIFDLRAAGYAIDTKETNGQAAYVLVEKAPPAPKPKAEPLCPKCSKPLIDLEPSLSLSILVGRCGRHGRTPVPA